MDQMDWLAAALALTVAALLGLWMLRLKRQLARGERCWLHRPYRMVRAVAFLGMAGTLWWMLATLLAFPTQATPELVRFAAPVAVAVTSAMLAGGAIAGLAPRRVRRR